MEKSRGIQLHNSVELVMKEQGISVQGAIDWLESYAAGVLDSFSANIRNLPSWDDDVDRRVKIYIHGIGQWIRGNDDWSYESGRYFGDNGRLVQRTRIMTFLPPKSGYVSK